MTDLPPDIGWGAGTSTNYYWPDISIQLNTSAAPLTTATTGWVDITQYVIDELQITRGLSGTVREHQPGSMRLTLMNDDRRFDPTHTGSPYWPNLRPRNRIRISATTTNSFTLPVTITLFEGYVRGWPQSYGHAFSSTVTLEVDDALALLARTPLPDSYYAWQMSQLATPMLWYRFGDPSFQSTCYDSSGNNRHGTYYAVNPSTAVVSAYVSQYQGTPAVPVSSRPSLDLQAAADANSPVTISGTTYNVFGEIQPPSGSIPSGLAYTFVVWGRFKQDPNNVASGFQRLFQFGNFGGGTQEYLTVTGTGNVTAYVRGQSVTYAAGAAIYDGNPHMIAMTRTANALRLYVDGVERGTPVTGQSWPVPATTDTFWLFGIGNNTGANVGEGRAYGQFGEVALWSQALTGTNIANLYTAGSAPLAGQSPSARIGSILDVAGWTGARNLDVTASGATLTPWLPSGDALTALRRAAASDGGQFYVTADHTARHVNRSNSVAGSVSARPLFSDSPTALDVTNYAAIEIDPLSEERLTNFVRVSWAGGQTRSDQSTANLGDGVLDVDTDLRFYADAQQLANDLAGVGAAPLPVGTMTVVPISNLELWAAMLLGPGVQISLRRHPQLVGSAIDQQMLVEQVTHRISEGRRWETEASFVGITSIASVSPTVPAVIIGSSFAATTGTAASIGFTVQTTQAPSSVTVSPTTGTATIGGSFPNYTLNIASPASGAVTYTVSATNTAGTGSSQIVVTGSAAPTAPVMSGLSVFNSSGPTGQALVTGFFVTNLGTGTVTITPSTWGPIVYSVGGSSWEASVTPTSAGTTAYTITATNAAGSSSQTWTVTATSAFRFDVSTLDGPDPLG